MKGAHTDPTKRHDFVLLFDVTRGNPNGDPDAGNMPRIDPETMHGLMTDVALKRKIRDYVAMHNSINNKPQSIFIQSKTALNSLIYKGFLDSGLQPTEIPMTDEELINWFEQAGIDGFSVQNGKLAYAGEVTKANDIQKILLDALGDADESTDLRPKLIDIARQLGRAGTKKVTTDERANAQGRLCEDYYDIRMFGAVLQTGLNAGQVRGPMQLTFARSIDPIAPLNNALTRKARTTLARMETGTTEMGRKSTVMYGLYRAHGFFNPFLAKQTGVTEDDLELFWEALTKMFEYDRSAARGEMAVRGAYVFTHESPLGNAPAHKLFDLVQIPPSEKDAPRCFADYTVAVNEAAKPADVTLTVLEG